MDGDTGEIKWRLENMMSNRNLGICIGMWIVLVATISFISSDAHEKAHFFIYQSYGVNSTIHTDPFLGSYTQATSELPTGERYWEMENLHLENEIQRYNGVGIEATLSVILLFLILNFGREVELKKGDEK